MAASKFYTDVWLLTQSALKLYNTADSHFVGFKAPAGQGTDLTFVVPGTDTASGVISSDGSGTLSIALIVNANVAAAAAIAVTKLAALTVSRAVVTDGSGFLSAATTTAAEIGFVNGVTSSIQTQLNGKASTALSNLTVAGLTADDLLYASSSSALTRLAIGTTGQVLTVVGGAPAWATLVTPTSFKYTWVTADTATVVITDSLASTDKIIQVFDISSGDTINVQTTRTTSNTTTVSASEAPPATSWRVLILAV